MTPLLLISDVVAILAAWLVWLSVRYVDCCLTNISPLYWNELVLTLPSYLMAILAMLLLLTVRYRHYSQRQPFWDELFQLGAVVLFGAAVQAVFFYALHLQPSRIAFVAQWCVLLTLFPLCRALFRRIFMRLHVWQIPVTLIGSGINAREAWQALCSEPQMGFVLSNIVVSDERSCLDWAKGARVLTLRESQSQLVPQSTQVIIALEEGQQDLQDDVVRHVARHARDVMVVPPVGRLPTLGLRPMHFMAHEALILSSRNLLNMQTVRICKRALDILLAFTMLLMLLPLLLTLMLMVARSGRPIFFAHERIGRNGRIFPCYKFRTMVPNSAEVLSRLLESDPAARAEWQREFKLRNDPRITLVGSFLRRTSLDELPQLWNVLRGDMSLVGPRPVIAEELERYGDDVCYYTQVRPGMTGLWQVSGRNDLDYEARVNLDAWYVRNWSLTTDVAILFKTLGVVVRGHGAY
ncbi:MAG: undecaprenyl-phosphate galactose phosphotransferase WbaP [Pseudomonadota bacterium]